MKEASELLEERIRVLREKKHVTQNIVTLLRIAAMPCKVTELTSVFDEEDLSSLLLK